VQIPFTAVVEDRKALVILSCLWMKTVSAFVRLDRPSTAAMPVPVPHHKNNQETVLSLKKSRMLHEPMSAKKIRNGNTITTKLRSQMTKQR
jgi:hypothetical protein